MTIDEHTILAKIVIDIAIFCEFTNDDLLNEDTAVEMLQQLAFRLKELDTVDKADITAQFERLSLDYPQEKIADFVRGLPESLGIA
jgi:hypothetical protein